MRVLGAEPTEVSTAEGREIRLRCTGYIKIFEAVELAAARMAGKPAEPRSESVYGWR